MKKLTLQKETLAELSADELTSVVGAGPEPTPPVYITMPQAACVLRKVTATTGPEPTPPISNNCRS